MPSSVGGSLLIFGAVTTSVSAVAGTIIAAAGVAWEAAIFYIAGRG